jgi:hypothetical protein
VVAFEVRMGVPAGAGAAVEFDEADAAFDQAAAEEAVAAEDGGFGFIEAVEGFGLFGFAGEVDDFGAGFLEGIGEFEAADAGFESRVVGVGGGVFAVLGGEELQAGALLFVGLAGGQFGVENGVGTLAEEGALIDGGEEAGAPVFGVAEGFAFVDHADECREVFVGCAEAVGDPGAEGGAAGEDVAGVHLADAAGVVEAVGLAGAEDGEFIGVFGDVGVEFADPDAGLAVLLPGAGAAHEGVVGRAHGGDGAAEAGGHGLAVELVEFGFGIE